MKKLLILSFLISNSVFAISSGPCRIYLEPKDQTFGHNADYGFYDLKHLIEEKGMEIVEDINLADVKIKTYANYLYTCHNVQASNLIIFIDSIINPDFRVLIDATNLNTKNTQRLEKLGYREMSYRKIDRKFSRLLNQIDCY